MVARFRFGLATLVTCSVLVLVVACGADGEGDALIQTDDAAAAPTSTTRLPPPSPPGPDAATDSGKDAAKDAANDAAKDSAVDAGPPAPTPGDACKTIDEIYKRTCGACGSQEALCLPKADGTPGEVSDYSPCVNELAGGCIPGSSDNEACGNCGTRKRTCTQYCAWTTGMCTGEPANACLPTLHDYTPAGCATTGVVRTRACSETCTWGFFSATCDALAYQLVVAAAPGDTISAIYPLRATMADKRMTGTCPNTSFSTTTNHPYAYVELVNPTSDTLTLSAWNTAAPNGGPILDTVMAWYEGSVAPARGDDAARKACAKGVNDACPAGVPCGNSKWAGLTNTQAITLPPLGSAIVWFGTYYAAGGSSLAEGNVKLVVRTDTAVP